MTLLVRSFSTSRLPAQASLPAWRDYLSEVYYNVDVKAGDGSRMRGELKEIRIGAIGISRFYADQQRVIRPAAAARLDGAEYFVLIFPVRQQAYFDQRGRSGFVSPGGVILLNSAEYYEASCPDGFENLTIKVPCDILRSRLPEIDDSCARLDLAHPALAKAVIGLASPLLSPETPLSGHQEHGVANSIVDLIELMIENGVSAGDRHSSAGALSRIKAFMHDNLANHELSPAAAAEDGGMSLRYLHKLFSASGTTFGKALLDMRLEQANRLIQSGRHSHTTLQQIAFACGFSSQSHFSTAFKAQFGVSPKLARGREG